MQFALRHPSAYVRRAVLPPGDPGTAARWMWFRLLRTLHPRKRGQDGEHHAGRVVRSLGLAGEEFKADTGGAQLLGELDALR